MDKTHSIIMADDSVYIRKIVSSCLTDTEFEVAGEGCNGAEALELVKEHSPDVVLMDVTMPGTSGTDALKLIMEAKPDAKVLMLSSLGTEEIVTECLALGAQTFIQKPFDRDVLLSHLRKAVGTEGGS